MREGADIIAVFQARTKGGAPIRANLDGEQPTLPAARRREETAERLIEADPDSGFWPDYIPPDD
jgi:hypothetical protein